MYFPSFFFSQLLPFNGKSLTARTLKLWKPRFKGTRHAGKGMSNVCGIDFYFCTLDCKLLQFLHATNRVKNLAISLPSAGDVSSSLRLHIGLGPRPHHEATTSLFTNLFRNINLTRRQSSLVTPCRAPPTIPRLHSEVLIKRDRKSTLTKKNTWRIETTSHDGFSRADKSRNTWTNGTDVRRTRNSTPAASDTS